MAPSDLEDAQLALEDYVDALVEMGHYRKAAESLCAGCRLPAMPEGARVMLSAALARRGLTLKPTEYDAWYVTAFAEGWDDYETTTQAPPVTAAEALRGR